MGERGLGKRSRGGQIFSRDTWFRGWFGAEGEGVEGGGGGDAACWVLLLSRKTIGENVWVLLGDATGCTS